MGKLGSDVALILILPQHLFNAYVQCSEGAGKKPTVMILRRVSSLFCRKKVTKGPHAAASGLVSHASKNSGKRHFQDGRACGGALTHIINRQQHEACLYIVN